MSNIGAAIREDLRRSNQRMRENNYARAAQRNAAVQVIFSRCNLRLSVYVETALPAALQMFINLACWDLSDVARWIFRPTGVPGSSKSPFRRKRRKNRGAKRLGRGKRSSPRLFGRVGNGNFIPDSPLAGRKVSDGVRNMWMIDGILQRVFFAIAVVSEVENFWHNWSVGIMQSNQGHGCGENSFASGWTDDQIHLGILGWYGLAVENEESHGFISLTGENVSVVAGTYSVQFGASPGELQGTDVTFETRVYEIFPGSGQIGERSGGTDNGNGGKDYVAGGSFTGPAVVQTQARVIGGNALEIAATTMAYTDVFTPPPPEEIICLGPDGPNLID